MKTLQMEFTNLKFIPSRGVTQAVFEIDSVYAEKIVETLGLPGASLWVEIKPIYPSAEIIFKGKE